MGILQIIKSVLAITEKITSYFNKKQLIDAGKAEAKIKHLQEAKNAIQKAVDVRRRARNKFKSDGGMPSDTEKYYRDE